MLEEHLPRVIDIKEVIGDLKAIFEGAWEYSCAGSKTYSLVSPVFTETGDLIVQLGGFAESTTTTATTTISAASSPLKLPRPLYLAARIGGRLVPETPIESFSLNGHVTANGSAVPKANGFHPVDGIKSMTRTMSGSLTSVVGSVRSLVTPPVVTAVGEAFAVDESKVTVVTPPVVTAVGEAFAVDESKVTVVTPPVVTAVGEALVVDGSGAVLGESKIGEITESMAVVSEAVSAATKTYVATPTMELPKLDAPILKLPVAEEVTVTETSTGSEPPLAAAGF
ncbi:hypothetical protein MSAN_00947400 [Mycena sanguinolenta]|uniref:Uncharacterized protein n=1 Tax=Mycena sanguinolenta TaxID=230812 RepID=A0A8H6YX80_9AGAR|nr:hypothetical protein MSAN_00947400 [Mycena sanguinolenta]